MQRFAPAVASIALAAWVGGLWAIGYLAAPVLFYSQPDRMLAGMLAGEMFTRIAWLGLAAGGFLLLFLLKRDGAAAMKAAPFRLVAAMLLLTLVSHFGIQPMMNGIKAQVAPMDVMHSEMASRFGMLHGISSLMYMIESLLGAWLAVKWHAER